MRTKPKPAVPGHVVHTLEMGRVGHDNKYTTACVIYMLIFQETNRDWNEKHRFMNESLNGLTATIPICPDAGPNLVLKTSLSSVFA